MRYLIVGAGMSGAVCARGLRDLGHDVVVIDSRQHIGGNSFSERDPQTGVNVHRYGPHFFHTNSKVAWDFVNRFETFVEYRYRAAVSFQGKSYSFPINLKTLQQVCGIQNSTEAKAYFDQFTTTSRPRNLEEYCLSTIGPKLYSMFIYGYTKKHWGRDPSRLPASIIQRLPIRLDSNDCYFDDRYQGLPQHGYTRMFRRMLEGIEVHLDKGFEPAMSARFDHTIYTGSIDELCNYELGALDYRSLRFRFQRAPSATAQQRAVVNFTGIDVPHTRVVNYARLDSLRNGDQSQTTLAYEYPEEWRPGKERFYPVRDAANCERYQHYKTIASARFRNLTLLGRLGTYRYLDMHQALGSALACVRRLTS